MFTNKAKNLQTSLQTQTSKTVPLRLLQNRDKLEITCHDGKPDGMLRVERRRYGLNDRGEVFRLSWGRTSLDPLDRYAVGTAIKSASFASQIVHIYIYHQIY